MAGQPVRNQNLTPREEEILTMVSSGLSNQEIADRLIISERTARSHVHAIFGKCGVRNRTELAILYRDENEIADDRELKRLREQLKSLHQEFVYLKLIMDKFEARLAESL